MRSSAMLLLVAFLGQCFVCAWQIQSRCPIVRLPNGRVRSRAKGRIVRFSCQEGFTLVGNKYSTCIRGQWDTPTPVCVNAECPVPPTPEHAVMAPKYNGAILIYFCEAGYLLIGNPEIYCDGKQWNSTTPHCRDTTAAAPTQCDFEKPDLCWWEQDPQHDFDWRRHNFETPSYHIGTGPTHDHTLGQGYDGHYLYIEASGRLVNDTARIVSPLYNASLTESGCFSFWYHMYGATIGALNVYFKEESAGAPRLMFTKAGDQGNQWLQGIFALPKTAVNFQIIIEGVRGKSYVSDIAIDDLAILQGDNCTVNKMETAGVTQSNDDQVELVNAQQSCRGRCDSGTLSATLSPTDTCVCTVDCGEYALCCPDFAEYCVLAFTDEPTANATEATPANRDATTRSTPGKNGSGISDIASIKPVYFGGNGISINPKDDIDPIASKPVARTTTKSAATNATTTKGKSPFKTTPRATTALPSTKEAHTKETPFMPSTTVTKRYVSLSNQTGSSTRVQDPEKLHRGGTSNFDIPSIVEGAAGLLIGVSMLALTVFIIIRRRKTYKRGTKGSGLSEDSDVRFLTSDEILDFNLARPSDDNDEP